MCLTFTFGLGLHYESILYFDLDKRLFVVDHTHKGRVLDSVRRRNPQRRLEVVLARRKVYEK